MGGRSLAGKAREGGSKLASKVDEHVGKRVRSAIDEVKKGSIPEGLNYLGNSIEGQKVRAVGRAMKYTAKQGAKNVIRGAGSAVGRTLTAAPNVAVKAIAGAALGATAGTIGVAAAVASGDPNNLIKYGGGAALAAGAIGASRTGVEVSNTESAMQIARAREYYGDKYDDVMAEKNMKKWKHNLEKRQELESYLGSEQAKRLYEDNKIDRYLKNEITDTKDIAALEKLQEEPGVSFNDAMVFYDAHSRYGDLKKGDPKKRKEIKEDYAEQFEQRGNSKDAASKKAQRIIDMTHTYDSLKKRFT